MKKRLFQIRFTAHNHFILMETKLQNGNNHEIFVNRIPKSD